MRQHRAPDQREHRMRLVHGARDREVCVLCLQALRQSGHQVERQEWRVARHGRDERVLRTHEPGVQARERAGETVDQIADHRMSERFVFRDVPVGVDQDLGDLRREAVDDVTDHRLSTQQDESLVDAAHAAALAARQDEPGDALLRHRRGSVRHR